MGKRTCGMDEVHQKLLETEPSYRAEYEKIEEATAKFARAYLKSFDEYLRVGVVNIPVVVHVVYHTEEENISDAQIKSQIDILNKDFRKLNADISSIPEEFKALTADAQINFQLALRDPDCKPTTGITRTQTSKFLFKNDHGVKSSATGGNDPWPSDKYLNLWVCSLKGGLLGYATFPGSPANIDGVVINNMAFGNMGTAEAPFNKGRSATHEISHWLNLRHIWGDANCGDDGAADTPLHNDKNYGCPVYPHKSTCTGQPTEMTMNYMDYTDDECMFMFTAGQVARMNATLYGPRNSILSSDALITAPTEPTADLFSQNTPKDVGDEPDAMSNLVYISDDIYIRRQDDGLNNQEHQNPVYSGPGSGPNYVYVRVRNRGCQNAANGNVKLYWAKASTALGWPAPWDGSVTKPALMGGLIGTQPIGQLAGGSFKILKFKWNPPNPDDYKSFRGDKTHFCLLSRIETSSSPPYGMTFPETSDLYANVRNNNNIVWKNITIAEKDPENTSKRAYVTIANPKEYALRIALNFKTSVKEGQKSIFDWGTVEIDLPPELFQRWKKTGSPGDGIKVGDEGKIYVLKPEASVDNIKLDKGELHTISANFVPDKKTKEEYNTFFFDIEQKGIKYSKTPIKTSEFKFMGGQRFVLMTMPTE